MSNKSKRYGKHVEWQNCMNSIWATILGTRRVCLQFLFYWVWLSAIRTICCSVLAVSELNRGWTCMCLQTLSLDSFNEKRTCLLWHSSLLLIKSSWQTNFSQLTKSLGRTEIQHKLLFWYCVLIVHSSGVHCVIFQNEHAVYTDQILPL